MNCAKLFELFRVLMHANIIQLLVRREEYSLRLFHVCILLLSRLHFFVSTLEILKVALDADWED